MKISKRLLSIFTIVFFIISMIVGFINIKVKAEGVLFREKPVKIAVFLYNFKDTYISLVHENFEEIQKNNQGQVEFSFYDGKNNQKEQDDELDIVLEGGNADLIFLNLVDTNTTMEAINKIKAKNLPVILFNREPVDINAIKSYSKSYFVGTNAAEAGKMQGKIIIDEWNSNKNMDRNGDNVLQYVMLMGEEGNIEAIERTKYSVSTIKSAGIEIQELAIKVCDWNRENARRAMEEIYLLFGNRIEAVISNNDEMAIGAIETLQKNGYNKGDKTITIPVVGVDATPEARKLIQEKIMAGSVIQDPHIMAEVIYKMGMNLVLEKKPLDGIPYSFDDTDVAVRLPYHEYKG